MGTHDKSGRFKYFAFISYSRKDEKWAKWLHAKLENYKLPSIARKDIKDELPNGIKPVFLDKTDIGTGALQQNLSRELEDSKFLIVICSPNAADSAWVNREVEHFKSLGREGNIIPFIVEGAPDARERAKQCYPPALGKDILGASVVELPREQAFVKVVATVLGLKFDDLWQRHERRRKRQRNIRYAMLTMLVLTLGISLYFLWDYNRVKSKYYVDYVDRWGVPEGLFELSPEQAKKNAEHFRFDYQRYKLRTVTSVNAQGAPIVSTKEYSEERPVKQEIKYSEAGKLERVDYLDQFDNVTISNKYSGEQFDEIDFRDSRGKDMASITHSGLGVTSLNTNQRTKINRHSVVRNKKGEIVKRLYKYGGFDNVNDGDGVYGHEYELDSIGRTIKVTYLDEKGKMKESSAGIAGMVFEYDEHGNLSSRTCFNAEEHYATGNDGFAQVRSTSDGNGNVIENSFYGSDGQPVIMKAGFSKVKRTFNDKVELTTVSFNGLNGEPVMDSSGVARYRYSYDENGMISETANYGTDDRLCYDRNRVSIYRSKYDGLFRIEESYFDTGRKPCYSKLRCAGVRYEDHEQITKQSFFDINGHLCCNNDGYASVETMHNGNNLPVEMRFFGADGKPCYCRAGYSVLKLEYDERGNMKSGSVYDIHGNSCLAYKAFSRVNTRFDESGRVLEYATFGMDGNPCYTDIAASCSFEYSPGSVTMSLHSADGSICLDDLWTGKTLIKYNDKGKAEMVYTYDEHGEPSISKNGFAIKRNEYDGHGNLIRESVYDAQGYPCAPNSVFVTEFEYDARGRWTEIRRYGLANKLIGWGEADGAAITRFSYDARGNRVKESYYDNNGNAINVGGFSAMVSVYDDKDNAIEERYYDSYGNLALNYWGGFAISKHEYDVYGSVIADYYYGAGGNPVLTKNNYASRKTAFDYRGNIVSTSFYGVNGDACLNSSGVHVLCSAYDELDNLVVDSSLDVNGKLCNDKYGMAKHIMTHDGHGNVTRTLYVPLDGITQPGYGPLLLTKYDERNNMIQKVFANADGSVCRTCNGGCPIVVNSYNNKRQLVEEAFYHDFDQPCHNFFKIQRQYDELGKEMKKTYVD